VVFGDSFRISRSLRRSLVLRKAGKVIPTILAATLRGSADLTLYISTLDCKLNITKSIECLDAISVRMMAFSMLVTGSYLTFHEMQEGWYFDIVLKYLQHRRGMPFDEVLVSCARSK
jgi:hypothetical protein